LENSNTSSIAHAAVVDQAVTATREHRCIDVAQDHEPGASHLPREPGREISGTAGNIKRPHTRPQSGYRQRKALPQPVRTARHQIIHQIIAIDHRIKHRAHALGLVLPAHALESKVGLFLLRAAHGLLIYL